MVSIGCELPPAPHPATGCSKTAIDIVAHRFRLLLIGTASPSNVSVPTTQETCQFQNCNDLSFENERAVKYMGLSDRPTAQLRCARVSCQTRRGRAQTTSHTRFFPMLG